MSNKDVKKIAVVCANGLGDGLMSMVFAQNLNSNGYEVTTCSNFLMQLQEWFPGKKICPFPEEKNIQDFFSQFDQVISTDGAFTCHLQSELGNKYKVYYEKDWSKSKTVLEHFINICAADFAIQSVTKNNGITAPLHLQFRKYHKRVIIHPMSACDKKNWYPKKFMSLAKCLQKKNYQPIFIVSPTERKIWKNIVNGQFPLPIFENMSEVAGFIYESGSMIGNDSGIGHLAANLGLPTVSLFSRQSVANLWRPNWNNGKVVVPSFQLPGARLRTQYWKKFLTVNKVLKTFTTLQKENI